MMENTGKQEQEITVETAIGRITGTESQLGHLDIALNFAYDRCTEMWRKSSVENNIDMCKWYDIKRREYAEIIEKLDNVLYGNIMHAVSGN